MSKPTIVGIIDKEYGFKDRDNALVVPQGDGEALAGAIRWSFENQDQLSDIGRRGQMLYLRKFSNDQVKDALLNILLPDSSKKGSDND
jgi:glycosyltransferase involved in cell wall biosynthesis